MPREVVHKGIWYRMYFHGKVEKLLPEGASPLEAQSAAVLAPDDPIGAELRRADEVMQELSGLRGEDDA
jgi:hypothetical protein